MQTDFSLAMLFFVILVLIIIFNDTAFNRVLTLIQAF